MILYTYECERVSEGVSERVRERASESETGAGGPWSSGGISVASLCVLFLHSMHVPRALS